MERVVFPHSLLSPSSSLRTPTSCSAGRAEDEFVELQWRNGQVVMHSQTHRTWPNPDLVSSHGEPSDPLVDPAMNEDPSPWVQFPGDDPLLRDFYMDFFHGLPIAEPISMEKVRENLEAPTLQAAPAEAQTVVEQIDHQFSEKRSELVPVPTDKEELPPLTSPKVPLTNGTDDSQAEFGDSEVHEVGGSASSTGVYKRKRKDTDESQCPSEEAGDESMVAARDCRRSITARRARATEVHNLSERRRRDRINEKMRALQELIPHCNKTDKASMLDEAIEYLKSLQLQVQMMWMRGFQHPLSPMSLPAFHVPIQLPGVAPANQPILSAPDMHRQHGLPLAALNMANFHGRSHLYAAYPQFQHHMQLPPQRGGQVTSLRPYGFKVMMDGSQMMMPTNEMPSSSPPL